MTDREKQIEEALGTIYEGMCWNNHQEPFNDIEVKRAMRSMAEWADSTSHYKILLAKAIHTLRNIQIGLPLSSSEYIQMTLNEISEKLNDN